MPKQKLAANNKEDKEERASRRKLWGVLLVLLLLVTGIVYAPPFARDHYINDTTTDRPKVATADEPKEDSVGGTVLGQTAKPPNGRAKTPASNKTLPDFVPTPTPDPQPLTPPTLPQLPTKPVLPTPDIPEPEEPVVEEPVVCEPPTLTEQDIVLTNNQDLEFDRYDDDLYQSLYVATTEDDCPVAWELLNTDDTAFWPGDDHTGKSGPIIMVIESDRNPETGMHHGNSLQLRFKVGQTETPVYEHQFKFFLHAEGNPTPLPYTINVKVITPEDATCYDEPCQPGDTQTPVDDNTEAPTETQVPVTE